MIDRDSKEHPQNKVNQIELPQLKKYFTKSKECQGRIHLIYCETRPLSKLSVYIVRNIKPLENILF